MSKSNKILPEVEILRLLELPSPSGSEDSDESEAGIVKIELYNKYEALLEAPSDDEESMFDDAVQFSVLSNVKSSVEISSSASCEPAVSDKKPGQIELKKITGLNLPSNSTLIACREPMCNGHIILICEKCHKNY